MFALVFCGLLSMLVVITPSYAKSIPHACAPSTPPIVPGVLVLPPAHAGVLFLNEVLLSTYKIWNCNPLAEKSGWIELWNAQDQPLNLYDVHTAIILNTGIQSNEYFLPAGSAIAAHGYLVLFPPNADIYTGSNSMKLSLLISGIVVDTVLVPSLGPDISYARTVDGGGIWQATTTPTIDASNDGIQQKAAVSSVIGATGSARIGGNVTATPYVEATTATQDNPQSRSTVSASQYSINITPTSTSVDSVVTAANPPQFHDASPSRDQMLVRVVVMGLLGVALVLTLLWCWRLFRRSG
jgi:hypothetical protein